MVNERHKVASRLNVKILSKGLEETQVSPCYRFRVQCSCACSQQDSLLHGFYKVYKVLTLSLA